MISLQQLRDHVQLIKNNAADDGHETELLAQWAFTLITANGASVSDANYAAAIQTVKNQPGHR